MKTHHPRMSREPAERTVPYRDAAGAWRSPPRPESGENGKDSVEQAVETAYRLVDAYVDRGRQAASRRGPFGKTSTDGTGMLLQTWQDLARLWMGVLQPGQTSPGAASEEPRNAAETAGKAPAAGEGMQVEVEVSSLLPTSVTIELHRKTELHALWATVLQSMDGPDLLPPQSVEITVVDGRLCLRLTVPAQQAPGTYVGMILDRQRKTAQGTLTVRVGVAR